MSEQLKTYTINKKTFEVEEYGYSEDESKYLKLRGIFDLVMTFDAKNYTRLWGKDIPANELARELAEIVASKHTIFKTEQDNSGDDVRYAVYWHDKDHRFIPVCIQDFDVQDYIEENFVRGANEVLEFWRSNFDATGFDCDALAEELATHVCNRLNNAAFVV